MRLASGKREDPFSGVIDSVNEVSVPTFSSLSSSINMTLADRLKFLLGMKSKPEKSDPRSLVILQRTAHQFTKQELQTAAERGWGRRFDGEEDPMYFVAADHAILTVVKAGPHLIRISFMPKRYVDDDKYALSQLPQPEQKKAWNEHHAVTVLEFFNDLSSKEQRVPDPEAYASLATLGLQLGDSNCTAIFVPIKNMMFPNDGTAEEGLRLMIKKKLPRRF
jgi:hypothetical protein